MHTAQIITVLGATCSGKSAVGRFFRSENWAWIEASDTLKKILSLEGLDNTLPCKKRLFELKGRDVVAQSIKTQIQQQQSSNTKVCITGFRMQEEIECLKSIPGSHLLTIFVKSSITTRFERSAQRKRADAALSFEKFQENSAWEYDLGLREVEKLCARVIENEGTLAELTEKLKQLEL